MRNNEKLANEWFEKGDADLDYAQVGFKETNHYGLTAFLCQQASEKYLKGYLVLKGKPPRKTHLLRSLVAACAKFDNSFTRLIDLCNLLDRYYIPPRYPVVQAVYSQKHGKEAIEAAKSIIDFVKSKIA